MSAAKPTYMRPVLEAAIASGELTREMRKAAKWSIVTIDALTARLAAAEQSRDFYRRRCDLLQEHQSAFRDPERTTVCNILANGAAKEGRDETAAGS